MKDNYIIGIIGAGNMGEALIRGLIRSHLVRPYEILASARSIKRVRFLEKSYGIHTTRKNHSVVGACGTIILAVKPQDMRSVCNKLRPLMTEDHLVISIAAGVDFAKLKKLLGPKPRVIRVMPNLPAVIDEGISAIFCGPRIQERYRRFAHQIFQAVGQTVDIRKERLMDVVTGISGTGPAYFFALMEALTGAGRKMGLNPKLANELTIKTAVGAAAMTLQTGLPPIELRRRVTSKKGTTWAAMKVLKRRKFWKSVEAAAIRATKRARELRKLDK